VASVVDEGRSMEHLWDGTDGGKAEVLKRKSYPSATLSTTNPTQTGQVVSATEKKGNKQTTTGKISDTVDVLDSEEKDAKMVPRTVQKTSVVFHKVPFLKCKGKTVKPVNTHPLKFC
jgi:hypothetical protein